MSTNIIICNNIKQICAVKTSNILRKFAENTCGFREESLSLPT